MKVGALANTSATLPLNAGKPGSFVQGSERFVQRRYLPQVVKSHYSMSAMLLPMRRKAPSVLLAYASILLAAAAWQDLTGSRVLPSTQAFPLFFVLRRSNGVCKGQPQLGQFYGTHGLAANQPVSLDA
jgi:hypothetical protein